MAHEVVVVPVVLRQIVHFIASIEKNDLILVVMLEYFLPIGQTGDRSFVELIRADFAVEDQIVKLFLYVVLYFVIRRTRACFGWEPACGSEPSSV